MSSSTAIIKSCLDILRRTDPRDAEKHLGSLASLLSNNNNDIADELYQRVDVPLKVGEDDQAEGRKFLLCEHNRDGDSHRSPWSNTYFPPLDDGFRPLERLRSLELHANEVFDVYRELYYGKTSSSVSSVYLWDNDNDEDGLFAGCFLIQNNISNGNYWNSVHVVDVGMVKKGKCIYQLTTTILLSITPQSSSSAAATTEDQWYNQTTTTTTGLMQNKKSKTNISGSLSRHNVRECSAEEGDNSSHIINIGKFIEDVESELRSEMDSLYIQKTKTVVEMIRKDGGGKETEGREHTRVLNEAVLAMAMDRKAKVV